MSYHFFLSEKETEHILKDIIFSARTPSETEVSNNTTIIRSAVANSTSDLPPHVTPVARALLSVPVAILSRLLISRLPADSVKPFPYV